MEKLLYYFSNHEDYLIFEEYLKKQNIVLIDTKPKTEKGVTVIDTIFKAQMSEVVLLNVNIQTLEEYSTRFVQNAGYYNYANSGAGIIQLLKSDMIRGNLKHGQLSANFNNNDAQTKKWVNDIFKWIKSNSKKVFRTTANMRVIADKPEKDFYSLLNAAEEFNGNNGHFLTIGEGIYCISKN